MAEQWTTLQVLDWTAGRFEEAGMESARLEAQVLVAHALSCDRVALYTQFDKPLAPEELAACRQLIRRRLAGEPTAYVTGSREFWSLPLKVDSRVLIPRPDTETVVQKVLELAADPAPTRIAELGIGSGAISIALLSELESTELVATDVSEDALAVASENFESSGVASRVTVKRGDLFEALAGEEPFDFVVANLPYIPSADIDELSAEVQKEPRLALDGGADGLTILRRFAEGVGEWLRPGGWAVAEHGYDQESAVQELFRQAGLEEVATTRDLGGNPRVTIGRRPG